MLTQTQLASINPETPARTLRYRCARLAREGLAGRSRPYRERGSAPHHLWPTRKGEAIVTGGPPPRGGERREPNPLFLAHAAGLSEVYVALATTLPDDVTLTRFEREADAREPFATWATRKKRAIAPDAFVEIADADGGSLLAFVELDMGTMSHRRLKQKASGYAEYAKAEALARAPPILPGAALPHHNREARPLLPRRDAPGAGARRDASDLRLRPRPATSLLRDRGALADRRRGRARHRPACRAARGATALRRSVGAGRRQSASAQEAEREQLRSDPEALRSHLQSRRPRDWGIERLGGSAAAALTLTLELDEPLDDREREALGTLGAMFADPLRVQLADREPTAEERRAFDALAERHRARQLQRVDELAARFGKGPALGRARQRLDEGELLGDYELSGLSTEAERDSEARAEQERLRERYLAWRAKEARRLAKAQGIAARLRNGPESFLDQIDCQALRLCRGCEEIAYPDPEWASHERGVRYDVAGRCHYCGSRALAEIEPATDEGGLP